MIKAIPQSRPAGAELQILIIVSSDLREALDGLDQWRSDRALDYRGQRLVLLLERGAGGATRRG